MLLILAGYQRKELEPVDEFGVKIITKPIEGHQ